MMKNTIINIYKKDYKSRFAIRYEGRLVESGDTWLCVEAFFSRDDVVTEYVVFRKGDRMLEWFHNDRWYNIFQLHDVTDDHLKGWYCNITRPADFTRENGSVTTIISDDLALDVFVDPFGNVFVMDEDEFAMLTLSRHERQAALDAVKYLREAVAKRTPPFDQIKPQTPV